MKKTVDNKVFEPFLLSQDDLWQTFCCLCHVSTCFKNDTGLLSKSKTRIGTSYSIWEDITSGVLKSSIVRPLPFNTFLCDLFLEDENNYFGNSADDTTWCIVGESTTEVLRSLASLAEKLFTWFASNQMKLNHDKCHLLLSSQENTSIQTENFTIICHK